MIGSSRLADARPVRNPPNSLRNTSRAPSMRRWRSLRSTSSGMACLSWECSAWLTDDRISPAAAEDLGETAILKYREHEDRDAVLACERNCRGIHHLQIARQHVEIVEPVKPHCTWHLVRIGVIDAIDLGRL